MTKELEYFVGLLGYRKEDDKIYNFITKANDGYMYDSFMEDGFCSESFSFHRNGVMFIFEYNSLVSIRCYLVELDNFKQYNNTLINNLTANSTRTDVLALLGEPKRQSVVRDDVPCLEYTYEKCGLVLDWESDKASSLSKQQTQTNVKNDISWVKYAYRKCGFNFDQKRTDVVALLDELKAKVKERDNGLWTGRHVWVKYAYDKFGKHFGVHFKFNKYTEKLEEITLDLDRV